MVLKHILQAVDEELATRARYHGQSPMVQVRLRAADCKKGKKCPTVSGRAKLDTGARKTFIAPSAAKKLRLKKTGSEIVKGIGGNGRRADKYAAIATIAGVEVPLVHHGIYAYPNLDKRGDVALVGTIAMAGGDGKKGLRVEYDAPSGRLKVKPSGKTARRR